MYLGAQRTRVLCPRPGSCAFEEMRARARLVERLTLANVHIAAEGVIKSSTTKLPAIGALTGKQEPLGVRLSPLAFPVAIKRDATRHDLLCRIHALPRSSNARRFFDAFALPVARRTPRPPRSLGRQAHPTDRVQQRTYYGAHG